MQTLKEEAIRLISQMPEPVDIDEIMYRLYVMDKVRKGKDASSSGRSLSVVDLKKDIEKW